MTMNCDTGCEEAEVYVGSLAPEELPIKIKAGLSGLDMTTVIGVNLTITRGDNTVSTWTTTIVSSSLNEMIVRHPYVLGDVPVEDLLAVAPIMTTVAGPIHAIPFNLRVLPLKPRR